jgi:hypothetical protein
VVNVDETPWSYQTQLIKYTTKIRAKLLVFEKSLNLTGSRVAISEHCTSIAARKLEWTQSKSFQSEGCLGQPLGGNYFK